MTQVLLYMNRMKSAPFNILRISLYTSLLLLSACAFDKMFLFPDKLLPDKTYTIYLRGEEKDSILLKYNNDSSLAEISNAQPYSIENVFFTNKKGIRLNGLFYKPNKVNENFTLLFLHGNAGNVLSHFSIVHHLALQGFQVLLFDYSGFGLSGGKATRKNALRDACAALDYLRSRKDVVNTNVVIYGQSLGGNMAPEVARLNKEKVRAVVIEGAFSSHDDIAAHATGLGFIAHMGVREEYSAINAVKKWHRPLLVIHSREDSIIPFQMGIKIFEKASEPKIFYAIDKPHIAGPVYYADSIAYKIKELLKIMY